MFTGIIEAFGIVVGIEQELGNIHFKIESDISKELKVDQSIAHDGVCLTVTHVGGNVHTVTAIAETLLRSSLGGWEVGSRINLERAMVAGARLDGHMVQGHVDTTAVCTDIHESAGSHYFHFEYEANKDHVLVDKGSVCVNGVSLTVVNPTQNTFSVAIIPFTIDHTNFGTLKIGEKVNLEFDIIGKYIAKYAQLYMEGMQ